MCNPGLPFSPVLNEGIGVELVYFYSCISSGQMLETLEAQQRALAVSRRVVGNLYKRSREK